MKIAIEKTHLVKTLGHITRVVERRNTIPILSNIVLATEGNSLRLKATDLDIEITDTVPAKVETAGATTVPGQLLFDIVRKLPEGADVTLKESDDNRVLSVGAGRSKFNLQTLPVEDFPEMTASGFSHSFSIEAKSLKWLIERTQFAISTEETRYYLNGIFFHTMVEGNDSKLRAVATDGHRLARVEIDAPEGSLGMPGIIVPRKTVTELGRMLDAQGSLTVEMSENKIRFTIGEVILTSKLIDGTFPDYQRVIPPLSNQVAIADRKGLASAADRVSIVSSDKGRALKMSVDADVLKLDVNNPEAGSAHEEVDISYDGAPLEIGFNSRYLADILSNVEDDEIRVHLTDPGSPTVFKSGKDDGALYILMPMRV